MGPTGDCEITGAYSWRGLGDPDVFTLAHFFLDPTMGVGVFHYSKFLIPDVLDHRKPKASATD